MAEVKLKDIAQAAGVSTVTVSNALSGKRGVSNDVREKIEEIARNMGYDFSRYEKKEGGYRIGVIASEMYMEMGTSFTGPCISRLCMLRPKAGARRCWRFWIQICRGGMSCRN